MRSRFVFYLVVIGMVMVALAVIVLVRDHSLDTELLGSGLVLGGVAIALVVAWVAGGGGGKD
jgi:hypothetical protein